MLDISAYNGIGSGRAAAVAISAVPPVCEPVKAMALMAGWAARAWPTTRPAPNSSENTPPGSPHASTAAATADPANSAVPGWALWALTITGQPAASAEAVSPPVTENASGKLLGPNTATGPTPMWRWRTSGAGRGARSGWASSMRTP